VPRRAPPDPGQLLLFPLSEPEPRAPTPADGEPLPDLHALFDELNARFFGGRIAADVIWSRRLTSSAGNCVPREGLIRLSAHYHRRRPGALPLSLAHEMCHMLEPGHGAAFRRIGAPIAAAFGVSWEKFRFCERYVDRSRHRYLYACPRCGFELPSVRSSAYSCMRCGPETYDERFRLALAESRARPGPAFLGERPLRANRESISRGAGGVKGGGSGSAKTTPGLLPHRLDLL